MVNDSNPFSTRFVRPGQIPMLGVTTDDLENLYKRWQRADFIGQIVGPHGAGKTTLTYGLESVIHHANRNNAGPACCFRRLTIRPKRFWPRINLSTNAPGCDPDESGLIETALVIDGIESLSPLNRLALVGYCRDRKMGLLLTTHRPLLGVTVLQQLKPSVQQLREIVDRLTREVDGQKIGDVVLEQAFRAADGNLRECLMLLYDWWESNACIDVKSAVEWAAGVES